MRLEMNGDKYRAEYKAGYPQTQTKGKVEIIETYLKPKHGGKAPILVAGDSSGDANMLTEYKDTKSIITYEKRRKIG